MALLPYAFDDLVDAFNNHNYGLGICPRDLWSVASPRYMRPWMCSGLRDFDEMEKQTHIGKDGFQVCLDVQHFAPNEISVKTVDNSIIIEGKHEEKRDEQGYISRQFARRYELPKGFKTEDVVSSLSSDGVLTLKASPAEAIEGNVRHVQIQQTGPARLNVSKNKNESKGKIEKKSK